MQLGCAPSNLSPALQGLPPNSILLAAHNIQIFRVQPDTTDVWNDGFAPEAAGRLALPLATIQSDVVLDDLQLIRRSVQQTIGLLESLRSRYRTTDNDLTHRCHFPSLTNGRSKLPESPSPYLELIKHRARGRGIKFICLERRVHDLSRNHGDGHALGNWHHLDSGNGRLHSLHGASAAGHAAIAHEAGRRKIPFAIDEVERIEERWRRAKIVFRHDEHKSIRRSYAFRPALRVLMRIIPKRRGGRARRRPAG
jgi:hypothetical protein